MIKNEKNYELVPKHSVLLRILHWGNFLLLFMMVWSGLMIYASNKIYGVIPNFVYDIFDLKYHLAEGLSIHFVLGWFFVLNFFVYLMYLLISKHYKELFPNLNSLKKLIPTILHDMGLIKKAPEHGKFNSAQQFAYSGIIFLLLIEILTGFGLYKPIQLSWLNSLFGGYRGARFIHFAVMLLICMFFVVHIVQVIRAGWNNFRAMVSGYEVKEVEAIDEELLSEVDIENSERIGEENKDV